MGSGTEPVKDKSVKVSPKPVKVAEAKPAKKGASKKGALPAAQAAQPQTTQDAGTLLDKAMRFSIFSAQKPGDVEGALKDKTISEEERAKFGIKDGLWKWMQANGPVDEKRLDKLLNDVQKFADYMGIDRDTAFTMYNDSQEFQDVDLDAAKTLEAQIATALNIGPKTTYEDVLGREDINGKMDDKKPGRIGNAEIRANIKTYLSTQGILEVEYNKLLITDKDRIPHMITICVIASGYSYDIQSKCRISTPLKPFDASKGFLKDAVLAYAGINSKAGAKEAADTEVAANTGDGDKTVKTKGKENKTSKTSSAKTTNATSEKIGGYLNSALTGKTPIAIQGAITKLNLFSEDAIKGYITEHKELYQEDGKWSDKTGKKLIDILRRLTKVGDKGRVPLFTEGNISGMLGLDIKSVSLIISDLKKAKG